MAGTRLTLRVDFSNNRALGPGKIRLLEAIKRTGSISQAGRSLGMSYRRAWLLIDDLNRCFCASVVRAKPGGARGGGATLTRFGESLVANYRAIEIKATAATRASVRTLEAALRDRRVGADAQRKTTIRQRAR